MLQFLETLVHHDKALLHQFALMLEFFLHPDHAFPQFDFVNRRRLAQTDLGQPLPEVLLDECDVLLCECHAVSLRVFR